MIHEGQEVATVQSVQSPRVETGRVCTTFTSTMSSLIVFMPCQLFTKPNCFPMVAGSASIQDSASSVIKLPTWKIVNFKIFRLKNLYFLGKWYYIIIYFTCYFLTSFAEFWMESGRNCLLGPSEHAEDICLEIINGDICSSLNSTCYFSHFDTPSPSPIQFRSLWVFFVAGRRGQA